MSYSARSLAFPQPPDSYMGGRTCIMIWPWPFYQPPYIYKLQKGYSSCVNTHEEYPFCTLIIAYGVLPEQGHYHDSEATVHLRSTSRSICLHRRISDIYAVWRHSCPIRTLPERSGVGRTGQPRRGRSFIIKATLIWVACMCIQRPPAPSWAWEPSVPPTRSAAQTPAACEASHAFSASD